MRFRIAEDVAALRRLRPAWEALFAECPDASPYDAFEWIEARLGESPTNKPAIAVAEDAEGCLAILPMMEEFPWTLPFPRNELEWAGGGWATVQTGLVARRAAGVPLIDELVRALGGKRLLGAVRLSLVPEGSPLLSAARSSSRCEVRKIGDSILIDLPVSAEEYLAGRSANRRSQIRSTLRKLMKLGKVELRRAGLDPGAPSAELDVLLDDAFAVSDSSWQASATTGRALGDAVSRPFVREASHRMASRGMLDLSVLYLNERPVSFIWGTCRWPSTTISKLAFSADLQAHRPGNAHLWLLIQDSIRRGGSRIDFGHEFADYKRRWGGGTAPRYEIRMFLPNLPSRLLRAWQRRPAWARRRRGSAGSREASGGDGGA